MAHTSLPVRLGLWRVTRHPAVARCYDRLADAGVVVAQLDRFTRVLGRPIEARLHDHDALTIESVDPAGCLPEFLEGAYLAPGDAVLLARRDGAVLGGCCVADRATYVPELRRRVRFPGAYLWDLYVRPSCRGRGIGTALIARAVELARSAFEARSIAALVAPDNFPSRAAFDAVGFSPDARFSTVGAFGRTWHGRTELGTAP